MVGWCFFFFFFFGGHRGHLVCHSHSISLYSMIFITVSIKEIAPNASLEFRAENMLICLMLDNIVSRRRMHILAPANKLVGYILWVICSADIKNGELMRNTGFAATLIDYICS